MGKRAPRPESVRRAIAASLLGRKKTESERSSISEGVRKWWARRPRKPKKKKIDFYLARDKARWKQERSRLEFEQWLKEQPLNVHRANFLYPEGFVLFKQIDPFDGQLLHVGFVPCEGEAYEHHQSSLRRNRRLKELFTNFETPVVEIVARNLSYSEALSYRRYLIQQERQRGREDE